MFDQTLGHTLVLFLLSVVSMTQLSLIRVEVRWGEWHACAGMHPFPSTAGISECPSPLGVTLEFPSLFLQSLAAHGQTGLLNLPLHSRWLWNGCSEFEQETVAPVPICPRMDDPGCSSWVVINSAGVCLTLACEADFLSCLWAIMCTFNGCVCHTGVILVEHDGLFVVLVDCELGSMIARC